MYKLFRNCLRRLCFFWVGGFWGGSPLHDRWAKSRIGYRRIASENYLRDSNHLRGYLPLKVQNLVLVDPVFVDWSLLILSIFPLAFVELTMQSPRTTFHHVMFRELLLALWISTKTLANLFCAILGNLSSLLWAK